MTDALRLPEDAPEELLIALDENGIEIEEGADGEGMTDEEFRAAVRSAVDDACNYIDDDVAPKREKALKFYRGDPIGNEEEGRSQIVMREVQDTVQAMIPSLMRVFTSSENAVEFSARRASKVEEAEQATDYVNLVFNEDNPGYSLLLTAFKDALISKIGVFKWYTESKTLVREYTYPSLEQGMVNLLAQSPGVEILGLEPTEAGSMNPDTGETLPPLFNVTFRRTSSERRQKVVCMPPEEFIVARNARDLDTADLVGSRSLKTLSELVEMGFDEEEIEEHGTTTSSFASNREAIVRNPDVELLTGHAATTSDDSMERYLYIEAYVRIDKDGDDIAELRRVCMINDDCYILFDEVVDDVKLAVICPDPEPHQVIGSSIADQVMDLQEVKTNIFRNTLDSLAQVIFPRTAVVEGQVNIDDVMNTEQGAIIRMTQPGMVQALSEPFVGQAAMPLLAYMDDVRASRTGISKASQGLDPDVLQSTTKAAVTATMSAAEQRLEIVARTFAETGIKRLFRGLLKEIVENQDQARTVNLRGKWVPIDPRSWDVDMGVVVNVGLGNGSSEQKLQTLMMVHADYEKIFQTLGPNNPFVDAKQYRDLKVKILELQGFKDAGKYYKEITPEVLQQMAQPQEPQKDPATILAEVEVQKIQADIQIAQDKATLEAVKFQKEDDLERDKLDADIALRSQEITLKYGAQAQTEQIYAMLQRNRDAQAHEIEQGRVAVDGHHKSQAREQQHARELQKLEMQKQQQQMAAQRAAQGVQ